MATETPWSEPGFTTPLEQWLGANWEQRLEDRWGSGWQASCAQELVYSVGGDWADRPDAVAEKLAELVSEEGLVQEELDPEQPLAIDLGDYPWLNSVAQSGSVQSWLVQVGAPEDLAAALADENGGAAAETASVDPDQPITVDLSQYEWFSTVTEADSLQAWLTRVGVPDDLATALAEANG